MWKTSPKTLELSDSKIDVWSVNINNYTNKLFDYWELLSSSEKEKADRFRFEKDKNCYVIARGLLRILLSRYLNIKSQKINFRYAEKGKPYLEHPSNIKFNLSHSKNYIVLAFTKNIELGIDVEYAKNNLEILQVAESFFSKQEIKALKSVQSIYRLSAFYNCWTRKEAFIKATGDGLSFPLNQFTVSLESSESAELIETLWDNKEKDLWSLETFTPQKDYIGAVASRNKIKGINYYKF